MKNLLKSLFVVSLSFFFLGTQAYAVVTNADELSYEIEKVEELVNVDFGSFYNHSEMIGETLSKFHLATSEFRLANRRSLDNLNKIHEQLLNLEETDEVSDYEKEEKKNDLLQKANQELNLTSSEISSLISTLSRSMPSLTYRRFKESFIDYYNNLGINESYIQY